MQRRWFPRRRRFVAWRRKELPLTGLGLCGIGSAIELPKTMGEQQSDQKAAQAGRQSVDHITNVKCSHLAEQWVGKGEIGEPPK